MAGVAHEEVAFGDLPAAGHAQAALERPRFRVDEEAVSLEEGLWSEAEELERVLVDFPLDVVIDLDVPTEIVLHRIAGRRVCVQCQTPYHVDNPPKEDWTCDVCGGDVVQRDDDTEEAVMRRLELWEIQTLPLIHFYRRRGLLAHVDGTGDSEDVFESLVATVEVRMSEDA